jgi:hypothetical protein
MIKGYTTREAIENYMVIEIDETFDEQIDEWIEAIEEYIDNETNNDFTPVAEDAVDEDRTFDGSGTNTLYIDAATEIVEVRLSEDGDPLDVDTYVLYPKRADTTRKIVLKSNKFPCGIENIYINGKWGYATVPQDIKLAATILVAGIINNAWQSESEVQSTTIGRYSVTYKTKEQIDDYQKVEGILQYNKIF